MQEQEGRPSGTITLLLVIVASGAAYFALRPQLTNNGQSGASALPRITSRATIDTGSVISTISATGSIVAVRQSNLTFDTSGIVKEIYVQLGQQVQAGQPLAKVDDSNQQALVQQAKLNLQAAQSALDKLLQPVDANTIAIAEASVKSAEGQYQSKASGGLTPQSAAAYQAKIQQAQQDKAYADQLAKDAAGRYAGTDPNFQMAQAQAGQAGFNLAIAQANYQAAQVGTSMLSAQASIAVAQAKLAQTKAGSTQSDIDSAQASVVSAQSQLDQAQYELSLTILKAPFAGEISQINIKAGQPASSAGSVSGTTFLPGAAMVITDLSSMYTDINVDEADITSIHPGEKVALTIDALTGAQLTGTVDRIYPLADISAAVITYPVHVIFDKTTQPLRAGMTTNATFNIKEVDKVVRVPNNFLRVNRASGQTTASVVNPDGVSVRTIPVRLGLAGADYTEIIDGLNVGDTVAVVAQQTQQ
ncbi:MAG TPA: efflux RND transporter periplasmic adaptor subunit [Aggregatilineales bacterium]|nr:efflux RND transporter periplasmic adaptor subunit [Aggregatilineales bacterium]